MTRVGALPFRAGRAAAKAVEPPALAFYQAVAKLVFGPSATLATDLLTETIPLYLEMSVSPDLIRHAASRAVRTWQNVESVIIDLTSASTYSLPTHHVMSGVLGFIDNDSVQRRRVYVLLIPMMFAAEDVNMAALAPFLDSNVVGLIADNGDHLGLTSQLANFQPTEYISALNTARASKLSTLRRKLIRFPGHFVRHTNSIHTHCVEFFFDGRLFERELVEALAEKAMSLQKSWPSYTVYYNAPVSPWLESAVLGLRERFEIDVFDLERMMKSRDHQIKGPIWLIVPLSDTGQTVQRLIHYVRSHGYSGPLAVLAVLSTTGEAQDDGELPVSVGGEQFVVNYLLKVDQTRVNYEDCLLCASNTAQGDPLNPDPFLSISTHAFWKLALELGISEEKNIPENRNTLGPVPQFDNITEASSAYLAYKIDALLKSLPSGRPPEVTVLCPDEDGARAIAESLDSVFDMTVIRIPKQALRRSRLYQGARLVDELIREYVNPSKPEWLLQLQSLRTIQYDLKTVKPAFGNSYGKVVIMDEINVSGATRNDLKEVAKAFGLEILCCLSVIDFSLPSTSQDRGLALYWIPRKIEEKSIDTQVQP